MGCRDLSAFIYHRLQKSLGVLKAELEKAPLDMGMVMSGSQDLLKHK